MCEKTKCRPLISIITVSYNAVMSIERTIQSVLNQTYKNYEYIIIDGGSTDGTVDIIKKYNDKLAFWISEPDDGIYDAMNKGILQSKGDFIGIINSDDWYSYDTLEIISNYVLENNLIDIFCGDMIVHSLSGYEYLLHSNSGKLKKRMSINHPTCFVRSSLYDKKMFSLLYRVAADYDFLLWAFVHNYAFCCIDKVLAHFTLGGVSSKNTIRCTDAFFIWKDYVGTYYACIYFMRDIIKKILKLLLKI